MKKSLKQRIKDAVQEEIEIVPYNPEWQNLFIEEKETLLNKLPHRLIKRIEHFGSTAIPGMAAKPIIDILVEVTSFEESKKYIVPLLKKAGYDYFRRPINNDNNSPHYHWFIKRNSEGKRTHHIHIVEKNSALWKGLIFRDYLREFPEEAKKYEEFKFSLAKKFIKDRIGYTESKTEIVIDILEKAKKNII